MPTIIHRRVDEIRAGVYPLTLARLGSGWLVAGETQVVRGYCLLLPDPVVPHLNALDGGTRAAFLADMVRCGDALLRATGADRVNYEILGNLEPALHCHLFPRRLDEPEETRTKPVWLHDWHSARDFDLNEDAEWVDPIRQIISVDKP